jgi:glutamine amidotransferase
MTMAVLDYGAGNVTSVIKALSVVGASPRVATSGSDLLAADSIVVPGVGHFGATRSIDEAARAAVVAAIDRGVPVLGICLGLHWLFDGSDEAPDAAGLGVFSGRCFALAARPERAAKVPHVGWNTLDLNSRSGRILDGLPPGSTAYFTHSYAAPVVADTSATTAHGSVFSSVVERGRVAGVQFHPEKSGTTGLRVLANFLSLTRAAR